jgi:outer membrane protein assembly complex protein YaeT
MLATLTLAAAALASPGHATTTTLDDIDASRDWKLRGVDVDGAGSVGASAVRKVMLTRPRRWFARWQALPVFDPVTFEADLGRIRSLYRSEGYYEAHIGHRLEIDEAPDEATDEVTAVVEIEPGEAVRVRSVEVAWDEPEPPASVRKAAEKAVPLEPGKRFREARYREGQDGIRGVLREHGYARARVARRAVVDRDDDSATVHYTATAGPACVFGAVGVTGVAEVEPAVVLREVAWEEGQPFDARLLARTKKNLEALNLFTVVTLHEDESHEGDSHEDDSHEGDSIDPVVAVTIDVLEGPEREVRLGIGYDTQELVRGLAAWRHYDFLGGARQLGFSGRASFIRLEAAADFLQPHFPTPHSRFRLLFSQIRDDEAAYLLNRSRMGPRVEWDLADTFGVFLQYRFDVSLLSDVPRPIVRRLPEAARPGLAFISGLFAGFAWTWTDDLLDPHRGWTASAEVDPTGGVLGGDVRFLLWRGQIRRYQPVIEKVVASLTFRYGTIDTLGQRNEDIPMYERFFAGGFDSVRGYARRRIGPLIPAVGGDPVGGNTLLETSIELSRPIVDKFVGVVFLDGGQVTVQSYEFPIDDLQLGTGFGVRYLTPIGPVGLDLGFPLDRRTDDPSWQLQVALGLAF